MNTHALLKRNHTACFKLFHVQSFSSSVLPFQELLKKICMMLNSTVQVSSFEVFPLNDIVCLKICYSILIFECSVEYQLMGRVSV